MAADSASCATDFVWPRSLFRSALQQLHLTPRAIHGLLQVTRTIADLAASQQIQANHLAEAIQYLPRL